MQKYSMQNFTGISDSKKILKFPKKEFIETFKQQPEQFSPQHIIETALGYYCFYLITSLISKKTKPENKELNFQLTYMLSDFEKTFLNKLPQQQRKKLLNKFSITANINENEICGQVGIKITDANQQKFELLIESNFTKLPVISNIYEHHSKSYILSLFKTMFSCLQKQFSSQITSTNQAQTKKTVNNKPEYLIFAASGLNQELKRFFTEEKDNLIIDAKLPLLAKNTKFGSLIFSYNNSNSLTNNDESILALQEQIFSQISKMSDLTVDVLNAIIHIWFTQKTDKNSFVLISADDLLFMRGKKENINQKNRRGGYKTKQRQQIIEQISLLANINLHIDNMPIITEHKGLKYFSKWSGTSPIIYANKPILLNNNYYFLVSPGEALKSTLYGAGLQTGLLHHKILEFDPYRYYWEKRIGNYLAWIWRTRQKKNDFLAPLKVESILKEITKEYQKPQHLRARFEQALDNLQNNYVIKNWQYQNINEENLSDKNWLAEWLNLKVIIEPPLQIIEHYSKIKKNNSKKFHSDKLIKNIKAKGLINTADELNINSQDLSKYISENC